MGRPLTASAPYYLERSNTRSTRSAWRRIPGGAPVYQYRPAPWERGIPAQCVLARR